MNSVSRPPSATTHLGVAAEGSRRRRLVEAFGFVAVWVALGFLLPGSDESYLLMGVPLTAGFQVLVRRRPLRELWVRDTSATTMDRRCLLLAGGLMVAPVYFGSQILGDGDWSLIGWWFAAVVGAGFAAFTLWSTSLVTTLRSAALPTAIGAGALTIGLGSLHVATGTPVDVFAIVGTVAKYLAVYFPVTFVLEEVAFRGALDAHVHRPGESRGWQSALFVSALWGLWHLPVSSGMPLPVLVLVLVAWHSLVGLPLSRAWRRTGNLAAPAFAHAAIDAVRNALLLGL